ncbi:hypothetical protein FJQ54_10430 [Sandaracinobacter neustonicus]|uniref:Uncharacterized protein n=1 Tax=Sandaracinobacter neustonicus TaxID=1715348 RepID=A0A501XIE6_9SPHN|nr:hypothetical protein [Sandaracinobacter neustonicus]TPE60428.1 hypothetical protein FJQ54_10430 [Sandaracinobacter neustonicus]
MIVLAAAKRQMRLRIFGSGHAMGHFSDLAIKQGEQKLRIKGIKGKMVCSGCFGDPHLVQVVKDNAVAAACDYCQRVELLRPRSRLFSVYASAN